MEFDTATDMPLEQRYRPEKLSHIYGQNDVITSLKAVIEKHRPQCYLFTGPSGVGKTSIARLLSELFGAKLVPLDGASNRGIDVIRDIVERSRYADLDGSQRMIVIDECHRLTPDAWEALQLPLEEPHGSTYWAFCTTEPVKVPKTIKSRCATFNLRPVSIDTLQEMLEDIDRWEKLNVSKEVRRVCAVEAMGSARQAIQNLSVCRACTTGEQARDLLFTAFESDDAFQLARLLCGTKPTTWNETATLIKSMLFAKKQESAESVRLIVLAYAVSCLLGPGDDRPEKDMKRVTKLLNVIEAFSREFQGNEKFAPLLLAAAKVLLTEG